MSRFRTEGKDIYDLFDRSENKLREYAQENNIRDISENFYLEIISPLVNYLASLPKKETPYFICLTGGQGSGKTTMSEFIQLVLNKFCNKRTVGFSIDDLYKTQEERKKLADEIHPLCEVRGMPGTHDMSLGFDLLDSLSKANNSSKTAIPAFNKPLDKHYPKNEWKVFTGKPDFIFFDAWCGGVKPISEDNWDPPINKLEEEMDPKGVWSKWSNQELSGDYQKFFSLIDLLILIRVPSMEHVFQSRWLQEQTLEKNTSNPEMLDKIMTQEEVYRFVMHYERLTRHILKDMPNYCDILIDRDESFNFRFTSTP